MVSFKKTTDITALAGKKNKTKEMHIVRLHSIYETKRFSQRITSLIT